jgi:hypothetical protein
MKHHVSLALLLTLLAALTLALLPPIANEPHYLFHRKDDRTVSVQQSYPPLDMTELVLINTASRTAEAPPEDGKYLRLPDRPRAWAIRLGLLPPRPARHAPSPSMAWTLCVTPPRISGICGRGARAKPRRRAR